MAPFGIDRRRAFHRYSKTIYGGLPRAVSFFGEKKKVDVRETSGVRRRIVFGGLRLLNDWHQSREL